MKRSISKPSGQHFLEHVEHRAARRGDAFAGDQVTGIGKGIVAHACSPVSNCEMVHSSDIAASTHCCIQSCSHMACI